MRSNFYIKLYSDLYCCVQNGELTRSRNPFSRGEFFKKMSLATTTATATATATATKKQKSKRFRFAKQKHDTCITLPYISLPSLHDYNVKLERLRVRFSPNGKREVVPHDQVFPLIVVNCLLFLLKN